MNPHHGTWQLSPHDLADLIFSSAVPATVVLTIRWTGQVPPIAVSIQVNGATPSNATLNAGAGERARTFRLASVNTIHVVATGSFAQSTDASGEYDITVL